MDLDEDALDNLSWLALRELLEGHGVDVLRDVDSSGATPRPLKRDLVKAARALARRSAAAGEQPAARARSADRKPATAASTNVFQGGPEDPNGLDALAEVAGGSSTARSRRKSVGWVDPTLLGGGIGTPPADTQLTPTQADTDPQTASGIAPGGRAESDDVDPGNQSEVIDTEDDADDDRVELEADEDGVPDYSSFTLADLRAYMAANEIDFPKRGRKAALVGQARGCYQAGMLKIPLDSPDAKGTPWERYTVQSAQPRRRRKSTHFTSSSLSGGTKSETRSEAPRRLAKSAVKPSPPKLRHLPDRKRKATSEVKTRSSPRLLAAVERESEPDNDTSSQLTRERTEILEKMVPQLAGVAVLLFIWILIWLYISRTGFPTLRKPYCALGSEEC